MHTCVCSWVYTSTTDTHIYLPLQNVTLCTWAQGFITLAASGALRICQLPPWTRLDTPWPLQKVNQGATVRQVAFHPPSQLCVLLVALEVRAPLSRVLSTTRLGVCKVVCGWCAGLQSSSRRSFSHVWLHHVGISS